MREKLKNPFRKLCNFALSKKGTKVEASSEIGEGLLTEASKCMQDAEDMRAKFEGFLANGQMISGAAYDFSRSLQDMASYMMETFGDIVDEEIGSIFSLLAKVQFEMSKLLDVFAAHVSETIIQPTEAMMTRIQQAAIMKDEYDEKMKLYAVTQMEKQKGKSKRGKGNQGSQLARESLNEHANNLYLYTQSLMRGQSESLVAQAVKYHSAQMRLFSKGLASISALEPMMRELALGKTIDRGLPEEEASNNGFLTSQEMDGEEKISTTDSHTDSTASTSRHLLVEQIEPPRCSSDSSEEFRPMRAAVSSKSAPISPLRHHKSEGTSKGLSIECGQERVFMYALPSPLNRSGRWVENTTGKRNSQKHSQIQILAAGDDYKPNHGTESGNDGMGDVILSRKIKDQFAEQQQHKSYKLKGIPSKKLNFFVDDAKEDCLSNHSPKSSRRYSQSGPLIDSAWIFNNSQAANPREASCPVIPREHLSPLYKSGPVSRSQMYAYACDSSPPPSSMPQISELYKLPLPPPGTLTPPKSPSNTPQQIAYSAPLGKMVHAGPSQPPGASCLPLPPPISRILSLRASTTHASDVKNDV